MIVYANLWHDHDRLVRRLLASHSHIEPPGRDAASRFLDLYDLTARVVPALPYRVHMSREIEGSAHYATARSAVDEIVGKLRAGESIQPYLSKAAAKLKTIDHMLVHWGIHHAHLSPISTVSNGHVERADLLLFFRIEDTNAYLIGIVPHNGHNAFEEEELVKVAHRNWPHLHFTLPARTAEPVSPSEIRELRKYRINAQFIAVDGAVLVPTAGIGASGRSLAGCNEFLAQQRRIANLELWLRLTYDAVFPRARGWITQLRLLAINDSGYVVLDVASDESAIIALEMNTEGVSVNVMEGDRHLHLRHPAVI